MPAERKAGQLYLVATPIGNLGDITRRAVEVLGAVDGVLAEDTRRTRKLISHLELGGVSLRACHEHNESSVIPAAVRDLSAGASLALVSDAGTPAISDPGYRLVQAAIAAGIDVVPIPGPSSVLAALIGSGLPTDRFTFLGYPPRRAGEKARFFADVADLAGTLVLLESPQRIRATLTAAAEELGSERAAAIGRELTKVHEEFLRGTLAELSAALPESPRGEITLCIAGATKEAAADAPAPEDLRDRYATLLAEGFDPRAARRALIQSTGLRRRDVYRALHLQAEPEED